MRNLILILSFALSLMVCVFIVNAQSPCPNVFKCGDTLADTRDGFNYPTLQIGTQCWFKVNLHATKYLNGDSIPHITNNTSWSNLTTGAWCDQENVASNGLTYGHLYNWYTLMDNRGLCPVGWYVPTLAEWNILVNFLGGPTAAGIALKAGPGLALGNPGNNSSGFTSLPGGWRCGTPGSWDCNTGYSGGFTYLGYSTEFGLSTVYNATRVYACYLDYVDVPAEIIVSNNPRTLGFSVRCFKEY